MGHRAGGELQGKDGGIVAELEGGREGGRGGENYYCRARGGRGRGGENYYCRARGREGGGEENYIAELEGGKGGAHNELITGLSIIMITYTAP